MAITAPRLPRVHVPGRRFITALPLIAVPLLVAVDLASVALVHISVPDDAGEAARAGVAAIQFERSATPQQAQLAFNAASEVADLHRLTLDRESFTVYADGAVALTASRKAPTLLFKHLPGLKDLTTSTESVTVGRPNW
jgi:hypothetical protein